MGTESPAPSKGYQKRIQKDEKPVQPLKAGKSSSQDYSSQTARKWSFLVEAIEKGNAEKVQQLIEEGINVNLLRDGATPLMLATSKGQTETAGVILQAGANVNAKNDDNWTALHKAAYDQTEIGIVELLLQSGVDLEAKNRANKTALQLAEEKGSHEIVKIIKQHQAKLRVEAGEWDTFLKSPEGKPWKQTAQLESLEFYSRFWWAPVLVLGGIGFFVGFLFGVIVLSGIIGVVLGLLIGSSVLLLKWNVNRYLDAIGPLPELDIHILRAKRKAGVPIMAVWKKESPAAEKTVEIQPADNTPGEQSIMGTWEKEAPAAVETVEIQSADNALEEQPVDHAGIQGRGSQQTRVIKKKISRRLVMYALSALIIAFLIGILVGAKDSLVRWYYAKKLENTGGQLSVQAFLAEVSKGNEASVELFIKAGINVGAKNENGQTALMIASEKGYANILRTLAKPGASALNLFDKSGNTALMTAARRGDETIVIALIESGADLNYTVLSNEGAATALQAALDTADFKEEHTRIVQYLLQHGANVKAPNKAGKFPLLFAADSGRTDAGKVLIEHGADIHDVDLNGRFALLAAACKGYSWFVSMLVDKGANVNMALPDGHTALMCAAQEGYGDTVKTLLDRGAQINARTTEAATALSDATRVGNIEVVTLLLAQGADPVSGYLPSAFIGLQGKPLAIKTKKTALNVLLKKIAKTASQDGYTVHKALNSARKIAMTAKGPWNKVLSDLATKNNLLLVVKGQEIFVLPYDTTGIKRENRGRL